VGGGSQGSKKTKGKGTRAREGKGRYKERRERGESTT